MKSIMLGVAMKMAAVATKASGLPETNWDSLATSGEVSLKKDLKWGGNWHFRLDGDVFNIAYQPLEAIIQDCFHMVVVWNGHQFDCRIDYRPDDPKTVKAALSLLEATYDMGLPAVIVDDLNDLFQRGRDVRVKAAMAEALEEAIPPEEDVEALPYTTPEEEKKHLRLYQGGALDGQKDPTKLN